MSMAAFDGMAPTYHIALFDKPTIVWNFHSLMLGIQLLRRMNMTKLKTRSRDGVSQPEPPTIRLTEFTTALIVAVNLRKLTAQSLLALLIAIMMVVLARASGGEKQLWKR